MDFFQRQDKARSQTVLLVLLFIVGLFLTAFLIHCVVIGVVSITADSHKDDFVYHLLNQPGLLLIDLLLVSLFVTLVALGKIVQLNKAGPDGIALSLGGKTVPRGSSDPREQRLYNVVEEIALAAGTPVPRVYIMDNEPSINACAIGTSPENAAVCVTRGTMDYLTRDELQGVIAHEFSHIVNNDVRINTKLIGYLFGLELIAMMAAVVLRTTYHLSFYTDSRSSSKDKGSSGTAIILIVFLVALALLIIGYVGVFFGNLIRAAISRQREYLADASAVQFTRNPDGIAGALKKIGCPNLGSQISNQNSVQASHLFFGSVFKAGFLQSLFQTHPPLVDRIKAIDPTFDGNFPKYVSKNNWADFSQSTETNASSNPLDRLTGRASKAAAGSLMAGLASEEVAVPNAQYFSKVEVPPVQERPRSEHLGFSREQIYGSSFENVIKSPQTASSQLGGAPRKLKVAETVLEEIPDELDTFLCDVEAAKASFYVILMGNSGDEIKAQRDIILRTEKYLYPKLGTAWSMLSRLGNATRLVVARKATPLLKTMKPAEYLVFRQTVIDLCNADGQLDIFEYALQASTIRELDLYFRLATEPKIAYKTFDSVAGQFGIVLSYLAHEGALESGDEVKAFNAGASVVTGNVRLIPASECSLATFSRALNDLMRAAPTVKRELLRAFYQCVADDGVITESEAATISAITAALGAPAPLWRDWTE